jgi:NAD+ diphosphatase
MAPIRFDDTEPGSLTGFALSSHDRREQLRGDPRVITSAFLDPTTLFVLIVGDRAVLDLSSGSAVVLIDAASASIVVGDRGMREDEAVYLGRRGDIACFALPIGTTPEVMPELGPFKAVDLRSLAVQSAVPGNDLGMVAQARSLIYWHTRHKYCANCGVMTALSQAGYRRDCGQCGAAHFPRTDPVSIMLAVDGEGCVLGRQSQFNPGMYSCLAGFIEPGETIENAVRREIAEEAGITIGRVSYFASQPWPFPASLMIGCHAEALSTEITMDDQELEDCRWFDRDEVSLMLAGTHPDGLGTPPPMASAHHIIRAFVEAPEP